MCIRDRRGDLLRPAAVDQVVAGLERVGIVGNGELPAEQAGNVVRLMGEHARARADVRTVAHKPQNAWKRKRRAEPQPELRLVRAHARVDDGGFRPGSRIVVHYAVGQRPVPLIQRHDRPARPIDGNRLYARRVHARRAKLRGAVAHHHLHRFAPVLRLSLIHI